MSLSERFSKLKSQSVANGRVNRQIIQNNSTKDKRNNQTQGRRGLQLRNSESSAKNPNVKGGKRLTKIGQSNMKGVSIFENLSRRLQ